MSEPVYGYGDTAVQLAEAVGLKADNVTGFTIEVFPDDVIRVRSNQQTTEDAIKQVISIFEANPGRPTVSPRPFIPPARFADLDARAAAGTLTNAERLALAVLAGGKEGESGVPALIDAAQEEYGHGTYRVPIRVVADKMRIKVVLVPPEGAPPPPAAMRNNVTAQVADWLTGDSPCLLMPAGWSIQVFEIAAPVEITDET